MKKGLGILDFKADVALKDIRFLSSITQPLLIVTYLSSFIAINFHKYTKYTIYTLWKNTKENV